MEQNAQNLKREMAPIVWPVSNEDGEYVRRAVHHDQLVDVRLLFAFDHLVIDDHHHHDHNKL